MKSERMDREDEDSISRFSSSKHWRPIPIDLRRQERRDSAVRGTHDRSAAGGIGQRERELERGAQNLDSSLSLSLSLSLSFPLGTNIEQDRAKCCCLRATVVQVESARLSGNFGVMLRSQGGSQTTSKFEWNCRMNPKLSADIVPSRCKMRSANTLCVQTPGSTVHRLAQPLRGGNALRGERERAGGGET